MKTNRIKKLLSILIAAGLFLPAATLLAQSAADTPQSASVASAPQLSDGPSQILRLAKASVGETTIIAFIKNSGNSYPLTADQIIYLRQQGVSNDAISAMLNQPKPAVATVAAPQTADTTVTTSAGTTITTPNGSTATVAPIVTYVQTVPASSVYVIPDTQTYYYNSRYYYQPYYYPYYGWSYPAVSLSFGFGGYHGGGFHSGGGYHGDGFHGGGGYHGGGGFHGGFHR